jgi:hypothetical protein
MFADIEEADKNKADNANAYNARYNISLLLRWHNVSD